MSDVEVRPAHDDDLPVVLELLRASMGRGDDPRFAELFRWKHLDNPFGRSPMWVACLGSDVVGFRVFMRWEFERGSSGEVVRAARAVDTATRPDAQGRGIFTKLTLHGLDALCAEGVAFVFNTPNDKSRPGYLKMGWSVAGRPTASLRPAGLAALARLGGARTAAEHWSEPVALGVAAPDLLRDGATVTRLLAGRQGAVALRTRLDAAVLAWRFGLPSLAYRAVVDDPDDGVAFVRVRRRGRAREAALVLALAGARAGARRRLFRLVRRAVRPHADYLLALGRPPGFVPVPRLGPIVTTRTVAAAPPAGIAGLDLALADLELF